MNSKPARPTMEERKAELIVRCSLQRRHMSNEIAILRAPSVLSGGSLLSTLTSGKFKIPLAVAGMVMGMVASRSSGGAPLISTGLSLFRMVQSLISTFRAKTA